ncbi:MAG: metal ABC transporter solute-binding protein, Zn/Mn family [Bacteroidales bacterium]
MKASKILFLISLSTFLFGTSCIQPKKEKTTITVSILPQKYFADRIVGNRMEVMCMVPAGSNPEAYDPSPNQLVQLNKSKAYLAVGNLGFELAWLDKLKQNHPELQLINASAGIPLIVENEKAEGKHDEGSEELHEHVGPDPHVWSSPKSARILAQNIYNAIVSIDSTHQKQYAKNLIALLSEIDTLDHQITLKLAKVKNRSFLIYHPALTYLARDYGLNQFSVEYNGKEPTPQHIKTLINVARKENIKVIFIQREFDAKNATILAKETGCRVVQIDPLNYEWAKGLTEIVDAIAK